MITNADLEAIAAGRVMDSTQAPQIARELIAARELVDAFRGLSHGVDWNNGTHAKLHGYRQKALDALAAYDAAREAE